MTVGLGEPHLMAVAPSGDIWVADQGDNQIAEFTPSGQKVFTGRVTNPGSLAFGPDGTAIMGTNLQEAALIAPSSHAITYVQEPEAGFVSFLDGEGNIWTSRQLIDGTPGSGMKYSPSGKVLLTADMGYGPATVDQNNHIWAIGVPVASAAASPNPAIGVSEYDTSGRYITSIRTIDLPRDLKVDQDGNVWGVVIDALYRIVPSTGKVSIFVLAGDIREYSLLGDKAYVVFRTQNVSDEFAIVGKDGVLGYSKPFPKALDGIAATDSSVWVGFEATNTIAQATVTASATAP